MQVDKKLEAYHEFRTYYFKVHSREEKQVTVEMYSTVYVLIKTKDGWENHQGNKNNMAVGLIGAVLKTLEIATESKLGLPQF